MICGVSAVVILLIAALIPILSPLSVNREFTVLNWGLFGIVGSLIAVFHGLRNSNEVEVGNTEGKKEVWRAVPGAALGLVAGVVAYSMVGGRIVGRSIFPDLSVKPSSIINIALSILVGIAAGFSFERIFERLRGATENGK